MNQSDFMQLYQAEDAFRGSLPWTEVTFSLSERGSQTLAQAATGGSGLSSSILSSAGGGQAMGAGASTSMLNLSQRQSDADILAEQQRQRQSSGVGQIRINGPFDTRGGWDSSQASINAQSWERVRQAGGLNPDGSINWDIMNPAAAARRRSA